MGDFFPGYSHSLRLGYGIAATARRAIICVTSTNSSSVRQKSRSGKSGVRTSNVIFTPDLNCSLIFSRKKAHSDSTASNGPLALPWIRLWSSAPVRYLGFPLISASPREVGDLLADSRRSRFAPRLGDFPGKLR